MKKRKVRNNDRAAATTLQRNAGKVAVSTEERSGGMGGKNSARPQTTFGGLKKHGDKLRVP